MERKVDLGTVGIPNEKYVNIHTGYAPPHVPRLLVRANLKVKTTQAKDFAANDCVMTAHGKARVTSATTTLAAEEEEAYTIVLKGKSDLVAVDGVFTHARTDGLDAAMGAQQKDGLLPRRKMTVHGIPRMTGFQTDVNAANKHTQAIVAKKTKAAV